MRNVLVPTRERKTTQHKKQPLFIAASFRHPGPSNDAATTSLVCSTGF
jgi:hypothetical protein